MLPESHTEWSTVEGIIFPFMTGHLLVALWVLGLTFMLMLVEIVLGIRISRILTRLFRDPRLFLTLDLSGLRDKSPEEYGAAVEAFLHRLAEPVSDEDAAKVEAVHEEERRALEQEAGMTAQEELQVDPPSIVWAKKVLLSRPTGWPESRVRTVLTDAPSPYGRYYLYATGGQPFVSPDGKDWKFLFTWDDPRVGDVYWRPR